MKILRAFVLTLALATALNAQEPLRLHGSTTVQAALEARQSQLEKVIGRDIEFSATGTNVGLASLAAGNADMAMLATPLAEVAQKLNDKTPGTIDIRQYRAAAIGHVKIAFIVNPHNRVRKLTSGQLVELLTGKIKNWKEVGGSDGAVLVVSLANAGSLVQHDFLRGAPITPAARLVPNATQIPAVVAQEANGIGIISTAHVKGPTSLVETDAEIFVPLFLVTKGEPTPEEKKLIEAARKMLDHAG